MLQSHTGTASPATRAAASAATARRFPTSAVPLAALDTIGQKVTVRRGAEIYAESDPADYCYRLVSGSVRTVKLMADGRRQVCEFLLQGELFGFEIESDYYFTAEAVSDSVLMRYPRHAIEALIAENPIFAREMRQLTARGLHGAYQRMVLLSHKSAQERIAWFLLDMADRTAGNRAAMSEKAVHLPMTRSDIADHLGMVIETVSRVFTQFRQAGTIAMESTHRIVLLNRPGLENVRGEL